MTKEHGEQSFPRPPFKYATPSLLCFSGRSFSREPKSLRPGLFKIKTWITGYCEECGKELAQNLQVVSTSASDEQLAAIGASRHASPPEEGYRLHPSQPLLCSSCRNLPHSFPSLPRY